MILDGASPVQQARKKHNLFPEGGVKSGDGALAPGNSTVFGSPTPAGFRGGAVAVDHPQASHTLFADRLV